MAATLEPQTQLYRDMMEAVRLDLQQRMDPAAYGTLLAEMKSILPSDNANPNMGGEADREDNAGALAGDGDGPREAGPVVPVTVLSGFLGGNDGLRVEDDFGDILRRA